MKLSNIMSVAGRNLSVAKLKISKQANIHKSMILVRNLRKSGNDALIAKLIPSFMKTIAVIMIFLQESFPHFFSNIPEPKFVICKFRGGIIG